MRNILAFLVFTLAIEPAFADVLYGVQITKVYAQSRFDSDAHLIQVNQTLSSACSVNRLYIDMNDKELFSSALANYIAGKPVDIVFAMNGTPKTAAGHTSGITCRVVSIF